MIMANFYVSCNVSKYNKRNREEL